MIWYENMIYRAARVVCYRTANFKEVIESNFGFVYATIENVRIYSCYFSSNMNHFIRAIAIHEQSIRKDRYIISMGEKCPEWNPKIFDKRGIEVSKMIKSLGLIVFNEEHELTFRRVIEEF